MLPAAARSSFAVCVVQIMRGISTSEKLTGKNHYALRVSPGIDYALMIAFCVVLDELFND